MSEAEQGLSQEELIAEHERHGVCAERIIATQVLMQEIRSRLEAIGFQVQKIEVTARDISYHRSVATINAVLGEQIPSISIHARDVPTLSTITAYSDNYRTPSEEVTRKLLEALSGIFLNAKNFEWEKSACAAQITFMVIASEKYPESL
ncbi:MAG: hypothetical protein K9L85_04280 [Candidatus Peribacteraceae bacterium]|nr:hypothetical protein [Candidatus Peribacteraceae bacterium]